MSTTAHLALEVQADPEQWDADMDDLVGAWRAGYMPPERLSVSAWADKHRILSATASSESGPWRTDRVPYTREIMDRLSPDDPAEWVVWMKASQVAGTEVGNNWVGFVIHQAPSPMLYVMPNLDDARFSSEQRIEPLIEESPVLSELVSTPPDVAKATRGRPAGRSALRKKFPNGILRLVGSNSSKSLRSMPARYVFFDEVDEYPTAVGKQGDPIALVEVRARTFWPRKFYACSSPTVRDRSKIEQLYEDTDKRRYFCPCPHCEHMQTIDWKRIKFERDDDGEVIPDTIGLKCESCQELIPEYHKTEMLLNGQWRATAVGRPGHVGYHLSSLYSPLGWYSWLQAVREFLRAKRRADELRDYELLRTWTNTVLAETWEENRGTVVEWQKIKVRAAPYELGVLPMGALLLTAGIDTQDDRVEVIVRAWGRDEQSWLIYHTVIHGDPDQPDTWKRLDPVLQRAWPHESGAQLYAVSAAVDSRGHRTQAVYNYARTRDPLVIAIAGQTQAGKPAIGRPRSVDVNYDGEVVKGGAQLWPVGSDTIKTMIYARLAMKEPGPGYMHYPVGLTDEFYKQLCGEKLITRHVKGVAIQEYHQFYHNVEALDCEVYAYAAAVRAGLQHVDWDELEAMVYQNISEQSGGGVDRTSKGSQHSAKHKLKKSPPRFPNR